MPAIPDSLLPSEEDLLYEEEILRNQYSLKLWWRYLQARGDALPKKRYLLYERALHALPGSYKLWYAYLKERQDAVRGLPINHPSRRDLVYTYERSLVTMHKMPRIWTDYCSFLIEQKLITQTRRTFDRSLKSLPASQHDRIWDLYLQFVREEGVPVETALRVYRRYLKLEPTHVEAYINFLTSAGRWQEAADKLAEVLNDESFTSVKGKTKHQLWLELCQLLTKHATDITGIKVDAIIRGGIRKFSDEVGRLWTSLADFYIRRGLFERARDVYEEGMGSVITVRDFSMIFDAYSQFEESVLAAKMEALESEEGGTEEGDADWLHDTDDLDLRLARLNLLVERRPELVSSVMLRQNPHNVHEWHKRAKLFEGNPVRQIQTYTEAVKTVDHEKAVGKPHTLWVSFARLYEQHADLPNARTILEKGIQAPYKTVDDLASLWCEWAEMELRNKNPKGARELLKRATVEPSFNVRRQAAAEGEDRVQLKVHRSLKLWSAYVDLEESLGTLDSTRPVYERILDLKIATPQTILSYALMLEEHKYFEDAFQVYERGVHIFKYPHVKDIWTAYLTKFVGRYGGKKLERARDLFEQALEKAPAEECKALFLQYAHLEEQFGLARHAMTVYERAAKGVPEAQKMGVYELYTARAAEFFGVPSTRPIYESAINAGLPDRDVKAMCLKYAALERQLGEIDRARAIYVHSSQYADPRSDAGFWDTWHAFEIAHGNEDTFREMLRVKRTVSANYSQTHFILPENMMQKALADGAATKAPPGATVDHMAALEKEALPPGPAKAPQFVSAGTQESRGVGQEGGTGTGPPTNPDDIELAEEEEEEEEGGGEGGQGKEADIAEVAQVEVPDAVFGALAGKAREMKEQEAKRAGEEEKLGAKERFKRRREQ